MQLQKLNHQLFSHPQVLNLGSESEKYIKDCMDNLDNYYILSKMLYGMEFLIRKNLTNKAEALYLLEEVIDIGCKLPLKNNLRFKLYYKIIQFLKEPNTSKFEELKFQLTHNRKRLSQQERMSISAVLINYSINTNNPNIEILFSLYKYRDEENLFVIDGSMDLNIFFNVVATALANKDRKWTEYFIEKYTQFIAQNFQEDVSYLTIAYIELTVGNYGDGLELLSRISSTAYPIKIRLYPMEIRCMLGKSLEDNVFTEIASRKINAFRQYFNKQKLNTTTISSYSNFCVFSNKILSWMEEKILHSRKENNARLAQIEKDIAAEPFLKFRDWLLQFITEDLN